MISHEWRELAPSDRFLFGLQTSCVIFRWLAFGLHIFAFIKPRPFVQSFFASPSYYEPSELLIDGDGELDPLNCFVQQSGSSRGRRSHEVKLFDVTPPNERQRVARHGFCHCRLMLWENRPVLTLNVALILNTEAEAYHWC